MAHVRLTRLRASSVLFGALAIAVVAACGPGGGGQGPVGPQRSGSEAAPSGSSAPTPGAASSTATGKTATKPAAATQPMKAIVASTMEADLREIGLDPKALPSLKKMDPAMLRKVMKLFTKALGVQCSHCHDTDAFEAPTAKKKIATHMWNDFTRALAMQDGSALFCDSCHGGKATFLDRSNIRSLADWMSENYEEKLVRADKKDHNCETCHGDPFEGKILSKLWK